MPGRAAVASHLADTAGVCFPTPIADISERFAEICGASPSKETISRIAGKVLQEMAAWCARPPDEGRPPQRGGPRGAISDWLTPGPSACRP